MATVLITAGPTREYLDDVRFLSNGSTGRMGYAIAAAARRAGHRVHLVAGPTELEPPEGVDVTPVVSAQDMARAVAERVAAVDVVFGAAAVADERPAQRAAGKAAKPAGPRTLELVPNPDIIAEVGRAAGTRSVVGFALQADGDWPAALSRGREKLLAKGLDAIVVNLAGAMGADASEVVIVFAEGADERLPQQDKADTAARLVELGVELWQRKKSGG